MNAWRTMVDVGRTKPLTSLHARYYICTIKSRAACNFIFCRSCSVLTFMQDTFRGRICECPVVDGVKFVGDGYTNCEGKLSMSS